MENAGILIVEDDYITATDLDFRLRRLGYAVRAICATGEEAILQARTLLPDLVIMDIKLDGPMDGIKAGRILTCDLKLPVIFLTAMSDQETLHRSRQAQPLGFVTKPVSDYQLKKVIDQALSLARLDHPVSPESP
jgi:1,2-diacylglycerol 3-beta-glucosyltransferase